MKKLLSTALCFVGLLAATASATPPQVNGLRAPAYPLITIDPYTSGWSFADNLYDQTIKHWTGSEFPMIGVVKVDGETFRFMGDEDIEMMPLAKTSLIGGWQSKYVTTQPSGEWASKSYDDSSWKSGIGAFGTKENEHTARTQWDTEKIWVRRDIELNEDLTGRHVYLEYSHDDDVTIYINGIEVVNSGNTCRKNVRLKLSEQIISKLVKGRNVIAAYCHNRGANGLLDFGLIMEKQNARHFNKSAVQKSVNVQAMQTIYTFECGKVDLQLTFTAPMFMDNLDLLSRPVNYISYQVNSRDGREHNVQVYFEAAASWALDKSVQESESKVFNQDGLLFLRTGSRTQNILAKSGDDVRIDWGYFYMAAQQAGTSYSVGECSAVRADFVNNRTKTRDDKGNYNRLSMVNDLGSVKAGKGMIMVGYDDIYSIQYFGKNLRPYWNRGGDQTIVGQFVKANNEYAKLMKKCEQFDAQLFDQATKVGGVKYAELCALAYRQAISAHKLVESEKGEVLFLSKENFSNGSIGTVDISYPSSPLFLLYNPELVKGMMNQIFEYSESGRWVKPFAAHDVGTYPMANGQTYGGDMPVEESGNMLIMTAAVAVVEGNAEYAKKHWKVLTTWTDYLVENGLDPNNQLCTDDFAGHFAHNSNLSIKAIVAIASYGYMAQMLGMNDVAAQYTAKAKDMATKWEKMANDGDHYRLTFDKPGTWSQKYNIVWDKLLKLDIFPKNIIPTEIAYYKNKQNKYGLPLDNRAQYTKSDWIIWTATLADDKATFEEFIAPVHLFMNETTDRIPMSDWTFTDSKLHRGFRARSVVGGYYIKMLENKLNKK